MGSANMERRRWDELSPDLLALIFHADLTLEEILTVIPCVCKSWGRVVSAPNFWQEIVIDELYMPNFRQKLDRMVRMLIARSGGSVRRIFADCLYNESISFIADHAGSLQSLELPFSKLCDSVAEEVAERFRSITFLDLSYCRHIGARGLKAFGRHCISLTRLRRCACLVGQQRSLTSHDDEASAISRTMPKLRRLEVLNLQLTTTGVLEILSGCKSLEFLDISGCEEVELDEESLKTEHPGLKVLGPATNSRRCSFDYWDLMDDDFGDCE